MTKESPRLLDEDPGFARLVAASKLDGPASSQIDKALVLANEAAMASRWTSWRWRGPGLAVGFAIIGTSVLGILATPETSSSRQNRLETHAVTSPASPRAPHVEAPVVTVSVDELASAEPPMPGPAPASQKLQAKAEVATPPARGSASTPPLEGSKASPSDNVTALPRAEAARTSFGEELALAREARSTLERGEVASCLRAVDRYRERFHSGLFAQEIEVIRIEALAASGDRATAHAAAERFLGANARSPYADRVRSLIERTSH